jgi:hypothetical protein
MIDTTGVEWLTVAEAARVVRVLPGTIRKWASPERGLVESHRHRGRLMVRLPDVMDAELAWRKSGRVRSPATQSLDKNDS